MSMKKTGKLIFSTAMCIALLSMTALADPVVGASGYNPGDSQAAGPGVAGTAISTQYGPVTQGYVTGSLSTDFANAVKKETTLLKTDDPVALYANETMDLGGASVIMIKGTQNAHQLCIVVETADKKRIVIDGGSADNTTYLYRYLCENGGYVDAWLVTHPHHDHAGALYSILSDPAGHPLDIRKIYCNTDVFPFLKEKEPEVRQSFLAAFTGALDSFNQKKLVRSMNAGMTFNVGSAEVRVINTPYQMETLPGNNSSVCYRITVNGKRLMILGDLAYDGAMKMIGEHAAEELKSDILQLSHHGQHGGCPQLYSMIAPTTALWSCSEDIWNRRLNAIDPSDDTYRPAVTWKWMKDLGVQRNYSMSFGNWLLK